MSRLGIGTDAQMAQELGVSPQTLSTWKRRGTIPYERIINLCIQNEYSLDEILSGRTSCGAIDQTLIKKVIDVLRSEDSELRGADLEVLLDTVIMMYNSVYKLEPNEAKLVMDAQLKALNLSAVSHVAQEWAKHAVSHRQELLDNPALVEKIPNPFKSAVKAILKDENYEVPNEGLGVTPSNKDVGSQQVKQHIEGENHTIAGRDISIKNE